jgi:hypothetical protein
MTEELVTLYRPTGAKELELVAKSGYRRWPPRLPEQPIFYPVENETYAREIASAWNASSESAGYVTRFLVRKSFIERYSLHQVGGGNHLEWWIPAADLDLLNENLVGLIEVIGEFHKNSSKIDR